MPGPPGSGWAYLGQTCSSVQQSGGFGVTVTDFQRLTLPSDRFVVEPPGGDVLVAMPTNIYALSDPVQLSASSLGEDVDVAATPESWTFDFGDGLVIGPTVDPGGAYPVLTNSHAYHNAGTFQVRVTTTYSGRYRVQDGPWSDIDGTATVTSAPVIVTAHTATTQLTGD